MESKYLNDLVDALFYDVTTLKINPFDTITVVCVDKRMINFLEAQWIKKTDKVLMNVEFITLNDFALKVMNVGKHYSTIKNDELIFHLIDILTSGEVNLSQKYQKYLSDNVRLFDFATNLSKIILEYDEFSKLDQLSNWQKEVYDKLIKIFNASNVATLSFIKNNIKSFNRLNNVYLFGFYNIPPIFEEIINNYEKEFGRIPTYKLLENDDRCANIMNGEIIGAPSNIREIEVVHGIICKLLNENKNLKANDFIVLSPNMNDYKSIIPSIFNQDGVDYPNVPYVISSSTNEETDEAVILNKLLEVYKKGFYTRTDFIELISNSLVQKIREITLLDVDNYKNAIVDMNIYRGNDWEYAKKRMLMSKISDINLTFDEAVVELDEKYLPYSKIGFDDESIIKFINLIDDLNSWLESMNKIKNNICDNETINILRCECSKWIALRDEDENIINFYFRKVDKAFSRWLNKNVNCNIDLLIYYLIKVSKRSTISRGIPFTGGVTFTDLKVNSILSSKYLFIIGTNSTSIPKRYIKSELECEDIDINISKRKLEEESFYIQAFNCDNLIISYINRDLLNDVENYKSIYINELENKNLSEDEHLRNISIDEDRDISELYTLRSTLNKNYYNDIMGVQKEDVKPTIDSPQSEKQKTFFTKDLADFLEEPLMYKAKKIFGKDSLLEEKLSVEFEPIVLSSLDASDITSKIILLRAKNHKINTNQIKEELKITHKLPFLNEKITEIEFNKYLSRAFIVDDILNGSEYRVVMLNDLTLDCESKWTLKSKNEIIVFNDHNYIEPKFKNDFKLNDYLNIYICSLMDIATKNINEEIIVKLYVPSPDLEFTTYNITSNRAVEILNNIYKLMTDFTDNFAAPFIKKDTFINPGKEIDINEFESSFRGDYSCWAYFDEAKLFDLDVDLGFDKEKLKEYYKKINEYVLFKK